MTPVQAAYLSWLMARHADVTSRLGMSRHPLFGDRVIAEFCAVSRELVALRREIQAAERAQRKAVAA